jgi:D-alanyl-D-alanine carboxypeptidase
MKCGVCKSEIPLNERRDHLIKYHKLDYNLTNWIIRTDDEYLTSDIRNSRKTSSTNLVSLTIGDHVSQQFNESIDETLKELPMVITHFQANNSLLSNVVTNQEDFVLGVFLSRIMSNFSFYCMNRSIRLSNNDLTQIYSYLFAKAPEFRESINESINESITGIQSP